MSEEIEDFPYWANMSEEDLEKMRQNKERLQFFRNFRNMTPEAYDQLQSVVEAMAGWDDNNASELLDRCPWCYADGGRHMRGCVTREAKKLKKLLPPRQENNQ